MHRTPESLSRESTASLLARALAEVRADRAAASDTMPAALVALHERSDDETRLAARALLLSADASERELAARIMREFGSPHVTPRTHAHEFLPALTRAVGSEDDEGALASALSALWWQGVPSGIETLLRFVEHPSPRVRETVASGLRTLAWIADGLTAPVAEALVRLARDPDPWVAGSVLYDVADTPEQFREHRDAFLDAARSAEDSGNEVLRGEGANARLVLEALPALPPRAPAADLLHDEIIELRLIRVLGPADALEWAPEARFLAVATELRFAIHRRVDGVRVGRIHLRLTDDATVVSAVGHVGYEVDEAHRRQGYGSRALAAIRGLARHYGIAPVWVFVAPDNPASRRTAERAGFTLVDTVDAAPEALAMGLEPALCRYVAGGADS